MSAKAKALIVDDGELGELRNALNALQVPYWHLRAASLKPPLPPVERLLATTARAAIALQLQRTRPKPGEPPMWLSFVPGDTKSQRNVLRRAGFDFLVPESVHPAALRLLVTRALFDGDNTQRVTRVPYGAPITWVGRLMRHRGILVDISPRGCRLLTKRPPRRGSKLTLQIPVNELSPLQLEGEVVRTAPAAGEGGQPGEMAVGVQFGRIDGVRRERLKKLLVEGLSGPRPYGDSSRLRYALPDVPNTEGPAEPNPDAPCARYEHRVDAFCAGSTRVLVGRDLSEGGMLVERHDGMRVGEQLRLALPGPAREEPLLVEAHVARDEGERGLLLLFDWMEPDDQKRLRKLIHNLPKIRRLADDTATHTVVPARVVRRNRQD